MATLCSQEFFREQYHSEPSSRLVPSTYLNRSLAWVSLVWGEGGVAGFLLSLTERHNTPEYPALKYPQLEL